MSKPITENYSETSTPVIDVPKLPDPEYIKGRIKDGINRTFAGGSLDRDDDWSRFGYDLGTQLKAHTEAEPPLPKTALEFLGQAQATMEERGKTYDTEGGERSMGKTVEAFNTITGHSLKESEGWLLMELLKNVRQWSTEGYHADSAIDGVAYSALKGEALARGK